MNALGHTTTEADSMHWAAIARRESAARAEATLERHAAAILNSLQIIEAEAWSVAGFEYVSGGPESYRIALEAADKATENRRKFALGSVR